jgi:vacuolar-type H+-ATPase subunit E/Vma4
MRRTRNELTTKCYHENRTPVAFFEQCLMSKQVSIQRVPTPSPEVSHFAALIREQADAEVEQIAREAEQRARRIRAAADAEVAAIDADARQAGEERGRRQAAALLAETESRGQREWLWARERLLEEVLLRVAAQLAALPVQPDTIEQLACLVDEGLAALPHEPVRVRVAPGYAALLGSLLDARRAGTERPYRVEADAIAGGGVIVETEAGRLCFDNSFTTRLRRLNDTLRAAAAAILFAG